ncbi:MAG: ROK family protein [Mycoplasmatales bacterium]
MNENILAIDIGGSSIKYALVNNNGQVLNSNEYKTCNEDIDIFKRDMLKIINKFEELKGIAISSPGAVDSTSKIIGGVSAVPCIHENEWVQELQKETGLNISIENDANCALLAEVWLGNAKQKNNVISVVIGTGIGGCIQINGEIYKGNDLMAGEFGLQLINTEDGLISTSRYLSTNALVNRVNKIVNASNGIDVFKLYDDDNKKVVVEVNEYFKELSVFIYNLQYTFNPDVILIGGAISNRSDLINKIKENYKVFDEEFEGTISTLNIHTCHFKNDANLIGAVYNFKKEFSNE